MTLPQEQLNKSNSYYSAFVRRYYQKKLNEFSQYVSLADRPPSSAISCAQQMLKVIRDDEEESYDIGKLFPANAAEQLEHFLAFSGQSTSVLLPQEKSYDLDARNFQYSEAMPLFDALRKMTGLAKDHLGCSLKPAVVSPDRAQSILNIVKYIKWIVEREKNSQRLFVCLLRDCLLTYFGLQMLKGQGFKINVAPVLINRDFLQFVSGAATKTIDDHVINELEEPLYQSLIEGSENCRYEDFFQAYSTHLTMNDLEEIVSIKSACSNVLSKYDAPISIVESGAQGTIPLLLLSTIKSRESNFYMFTSVPWLQNLYRDRIYTNNYLHLRSIETLSCQSQMMKFALFDGLSVYVKFCKDEQVVSRSLEELTYFHTVMVDEFDLNLRNCWDTMHDSF